MGTYICGLEGVRAINYEIRYMLILLTTIINQRPVLAPTKRIRWETVFRISNFQRVISLVYLGMLGMEKTISEDCKLDFYQKYKKELLLFESYKNAEEVILWQLERYGIDALLLSDTSTDGLYPKPEMACMGPLEILVERKNLLKVHRIMRDMDYEEQEDRLGNGMIFTRVPGIRIAFYDQIPVGGAAYKRYFSPPIKRHMHMEKYKSIHILSEEEEYLYRAGRLVEFYIKGTLKIRDILDFWQYQKTLDENFPWKTVREFLEKARLSEFVQQITLLSILWFGDGARRQYGIALELEEYVLSNCRENQHLDDILLPHEKNRLDFYWRNWDKEWLQKKKAWIFPSRDYMERFFPVLSKHPWLLCFCWLVRDVRFLKKIGLKKLKKAWFQICVRFIDVREKIKSLIKRKTGDEEESAAEETESEEAAVKEQEPEGLTNRKEIKGDRHVEEIESQE